MLREPAEEFVSKNIAGTLAITRLLWFLLVRFRNSLFQLPSLRAEDSLLVWI